MEKKYKFKITNLAIILFLFLGIFNDSKYGTTLSWVFSSFILLVIGRIIENSHFSIKKIHVIAFFLWFICFFSTVISPVVEIQRDIYTSFAFIFMFFLITSDDSLKNYYNIFIVFYLLIIVLVSLIIIVNWLSGVYFSEYYKRATLVVNGVKKDPNYVSAFIVPAPTLLSLFSRKKNIKQIIVLFFDCICLLAIICTGSRAALILFMASFALLFLFGNYSRKTKITLIIFVIFLAGVCFALFSNVFKNYLNRFLEIKDDPRKELWKAAIIPFCQNPIFGQGLGASCYYSNMIAGNDSHNMYIDILSNTGLIGFILYFLLIYNCIKFSNKEVRKGTFILAFAFLSPQFFINGFNTASQWIPILMIYFYAVYSRNQEQCNNDKHVKNL